MKHMLSTELILFFISGAIALAEYLADNAKIVRLDLRENDIRTGGLMALSLAMKVNKILLRLDLDKDIKRDTVSVASCIRIVAKNQSVCTCITY